MVHLGVPSICGVLLEPGSSLFDVPISWCVSTVAFARVLAFRRHLGDGYFYDCRALSVEDDALGWSGSVGSG